MSESIKVFVSELLADETARALADAGLGEGYEVIAYPVDFAQPGKSLDALDELLGQASAKDTVCIVGSEWVPGPETLHRIPSANCRFIYALSSMELLVGKEPVGHPLEKGDLVLVPGELRRWKEIAAVPERLAGYARIVLLDTAGDGSAGPYLNELGAHLGKPAIAYRVGLELLQLKLSNCILAARAEGLAISVEASMRAHARSRADSAMALDLISTMSQQTEESTVISSIVELMEMLFSPKAIRYFSISGERMEAFDGYGRSESTEGFDLEALEDVDARWDEATHGLRFRIASKGSTVGAVVMDGMIYPESRGEYLAMVKNMSSVFGLAISNARTFRGYIESERRAEEALQVERATLEISERFIGGTEMAAAMAESLGIIGRTARCHRATAFTVSDDISAIEAREEWLADSVQSGRGRYQSVPIASIGWLWDMLNSRETVLVEDAALLPEDAVGQLSPFLSSGALAMAWAPVLVDGRVKGAVCLQDLASPRRWREDHVRMLSFLANTISVTLQQAKTREDVKKLNESLQISNKVLRHDIRNELMVLSGSLSLLEMKNDPKYLERALRSTKKIDDMLDQQKELDQFLLSSKGLFPVILSELIAKTMQGYQMPYGIKGDGTVMADFALGSIIDNLVRNSRRHGEASRMDFEISEGQQFVLLRVADDGKGIPEEIRDRVFTEGYSYGEHKGTGLGLFLVKKTVERYGGWIRCEDNLPRGAVFVIGLPRVIWVT